MSDISNNSKQLALSIEEEFNSLSELSLDELVEEAEVSVKLGRTFHAKKLSTAGVVGYWNIMNDIQEELARLSLELDEKILEVNKMIEDGWNDESAQDMDILDTIDERSNYEKYISKKREVDVIKKAKLSTQSKYVDLLNKGGFKETSSPTNKSNIGIFIDFEKGEEKKNSNGDFGVSAFGREKKKKPNKVPEGDIIDIIE